MGSCTGRVGQMIALLGVVMGMVFLLACIEAVILVLAGLAELVGRIWGRK